MCLDTKTLVWRNWKLVLRSCRNNHDTLDISATLCYEVTEISRTSCVASASCQVKIFNSV